MIQWLNVFTIRRGNRILPYIISVCGTSWRGGAFYGESKSLYLKLIRWTACTQGVIMAPGRHDWFGAREWKVGGGGGGGGGGGDSLPMSCGVPPPILKTFLR